MKELFEYFAAENEYPDLDADGAVSRLAKALTYKTISNTDLSKVDYSQFDGLLAHMRDSYPAVFRTGEFELIKGHSILIKIEGTDKSLKPCLYMSHQDVVPVVEGTEKDWKYEAYSGTVADGYIWGRGALDIKNQVFAELEACEYLLSHGCEFKRTAYFAFGEDEETLNRGALAIAEELKRRGVELEFVLDEGGGKLESGDVFGAEDIAVSQICLMEKGYADLELKVESKGGHSSNPFGGTSLANIAQAIADISRNPFEFRLPTAIKEAFRALAPYVNKEPLRSYVNDVDANEAELIDYCYNNKALFPFITTTIAPTMIEGGSAACNVMPQNMRAVINFRLNEGDTVDSVMEHCRRSVRAGGIEMSFIQANDPSATARIDGLGYKNLTAALKHFYPDVVFIPSMSAGATDAHHYEIVCDTCIRCCPFLSEAEEVKLGVHGTNERISIRSYIQGIKVLIKIMEMSNL